MTYNLRKPVSLGEKSRINSQEIDEEKSKEEYEAEEVEEEKSYIVQGDEDKLPIVEIKKNAVSIEGKETNIEQYKEIKEEKLRGVSLKNMKRGWKRPDTVCWCEKQLNSEEESCTRCKELFQDIETLECLVDNLNEKLGISWETQEYTNLEKSQQAKVEELMKNNKVLFAEGLTQLERTKEEIHSIILKEGVDPVKQRPYR
ncbi:26997_t:CDS:1, partial [Gigaspora margarita]